MKLVKMNWKKVCKKNLDSYTVENYLGSFFEKLIVKSVNSKTL